MKQVIIELGEKSYPVYIGKGIHSKIADVLKEHRISNQIVIITDRNVAKHHLSKFKKQLKTVGNVVNTIVIPAGEKQKSWQRLQAVLAEIVRLKLSRNAVIVALGGGVVGDLAGFAAATFRRGIAFIQVPTTLLSQLDSSVGGKVGVNFLENKNIIGAFHQPKFVLSDVEFLKTLPKREIICGIGEMLKYGILGGEDTFKFLNSNLNEINKLNLEVVEETIFHCVNIKAKMVSEDEKELFKTGGRVPLNIGHAVGHALEALSNYRLHHGEAVLLGLRVETDIANEMGILKEKDYGLITDYLYRIKFQPDLSYIKLKNIIDYLAAGKGGAKTRFVLPKKIGSVEVTSEVSLSIIQRLLRKKFSSNNRQIP